MRKNFILDTGPWRMTPQKIPAPKSFVHVGLLAGLAVITAIILGALVLGAR
jgi:hypothetical protein